jgi:hypothetical protein
MKGELERMWKETVVACVHSQYCPYTFTRPPVSYILGRFGLLKRRDPIYSLSQRHMPEERNPQFYSLLEFDVVIILSDLSEEISASIFRVKINLSSSKLQQNTLCNKQLDVPYVDLNRGRTFLSTVEPGYNDVGLCDVYNVRYSVVPINSSLLTITLHYSVITTLVCNDTKY